LVATGVGAVDATGAPVDGLIDGDRIGDSPPAESTVEDAPAADPVGVLDELRNTVPTMVAAANATKAIPSAAVIQASTGRRVVVGSGCTARP
jgi:hypothetical protein